jgi:hypothetical protein
MSLELVLLADVYAVCRLDPEAGPQSWAGRGELVSVTRTPRETSIVCPQERVPGGVVREGGFRALRIQGPLDFALTGILDSLLHPLAEEKIAVFAISTYDTDYILVRDEALGRAAEILIRSGHNIIPPE